MPAIRSEQDIAGYRDVLATIHQNYDYIPPKLAMILQLNRDLYKFSSNQDAGAFKNLNNILFE